MYRVRFITFERFAALVGEQQLDFHPIHWAFTASTSPKHMARKQAFPLVGVTKPCFPAYNRATYRVAERLVWLMFRRVINHWRMQTLSLSPLPLTGYSDRLGTQQIPILNGFSDHIIPRPADWNEHIHTTGDWVPEHTHWPPC